MKGGSGRWISEPQHSGVVAGHAAKVRHICDGYRQILDADLVDPDEIVASIRLRNIQTPRATLVSFPRTEAAEKVLQVLTQGQFDSAPVIDDSQIAAMDFADLFSVIGEASALLQRLGPYTREEWLDSVKDLICELRNDVMHNVRTFATDEPGSLRHLIDLDERVRTLLSASAPTA